MLGSFAVPHGVAPTSCILGSQSFKNQDDKDTHAMCNSASATAQEGHSSNSGVDPNL